MLFTALRRVELVTLTVGHLLQRDGYWLIVDMVGKLAPVRSIKLSPEVKKLIDKWH